MNTDTLQDDIKKFSHSTKARKGLRILVVLVLILLSFHAGVRAGFRRAEFAGRLGDNYSRMFGSHRPGPRGMPEFLRGPEVPGGHGVNGTVVSVNTDGSFVVEGQDNVERVVRPASGTLVRRLDANASTSDVRVGDDVVILGRPEGSGEISATLIRIIPSASSAQEQ